MFQRINPFRPVSQASRDRQTYIPPHMKHAMDEYMQHSMPAHLKKYQDADTYVPQHAANAMAEHLENNLPPHLKEYAGAYLQQNVIQPGMVVRSDVAGSAGAQPPPAGGPSAPGTVSPGMPQNLPVAGGSAVVGGEQTPLPPPDPLPGEVSSSPSIPDPNQASSSSADPNYSFIMDSPKPPRQNPLASLLSGGSMVMRIGVAAGGLIILIIIFAVLRGLLSSGGNFASMVTVAEDQQEIIHLAKGAVPEQAISAQNKAAVATIQLAMSSSQSQLLTYLAAQHTKVSAKKLALKVSLETDDQLKAATLTGSYNQLLQQILQSKLNSYSRDLQRSYQENKGKKGRALLSDSYRQAQLFQLQLASSVP